MAQNKALNLVLNLVCLIWIAPLFLSFIVAGSFTMSGGVDTSYVMGPMLLGCVLIPVAYLIAFIISNVREDRRFFFAMLTGYAVCATLSIGLSLLAPSAGTVVAWIWFAYAIAALVLALLRARGYLERIELKKSGKLQEGKSSQRLSVSFRKKRDHGARDSENRSSATPATRDDADTRTSLDDVLGVASRTAPQSAAEEPEDACAASQGDAAHDAIDVGDVAAQTSAAFTALQVPQQVDVNSCQMTDLLVLPGMTMAIARQIVSEREAHGPYESVQQLVVRNDLKPHAIVKFLGCLSIAPTAEQNGTGHRARMLDL